MSDRSNFHGQIMDVRVLAAFAASSSPADKPKVSLGAAWRTWRLGG